MRMKLIANVEVSKFPFLIGKVLTREAQLEFLDKDGKVLWRFPFLIGKVLTIYANARRSNV